MLGEQMLHYLIITMGIYTYVWIVTKTIIHSTRKYATSSGHTTHAMHHMIRQCIINPLSFIYCCIGRLRRRQECEIGYHYPIILNHHTALTLNIANYGLDRRIPVNPLILVTRITHYLLGSIEHLHDTVNIGHSCVSYFSHDKLK